jgi:hypothetical protein
MIGRRYLALNIVYALTCMTHPFTALTLFAIIALYFLLSTVINRKLPDKLSVVAFALISGINFWYLYIFLQGFAEAANIALQMKTIYVPTTSMTEYMAAYGIYLLVPVIYFLLNPSRAFRDMLRSLKDEKWLAVFSWLAALFILINNHHFLKTPVQPDRFDSGRIMVPLVISTFMIFQKIYEKRENFGIKASILLVILMLSSIPDNIVYSIQVYKQIQTSGVLRLGSDVRNLLDFLNRESGIKFIFNTDPETGYIIPTYTKHRTFLNHWDQTPYLREKEQDIEKFLKDKNFDIVKKYSADMLLLRRKEWDEIMDSGKGDALTMLFSSGDLVLFSFKENFKQRTPI